MKEASGNDLVYEHCVSQYKHNFQCSLGVLDWIKNHLKGHNVGKICQSIKLFKYEK